MVFEVLKKPACLGCVHYDWALQDSLHGLAFPVWIDICNKGCEVVGCIADSKDCEFFEALGL